MSLAVVVGVIAYFGYGMLFGSPSVTTMVQRATGDGGASCLKEGIMAFAGSTESVYDCSVRDTRRCYVSVKDGLYEVTTNIAAMKKLGVESASGFLCG